MQGWLWCAHTVNPAFEPITVEPEDAGDLTIVGEFVRVAS
jgi:hypothetical protein